ncbi:MAG: hypothetical protein KA792_03910 [Bacteroidales bacterium]|nr:hypothetical protein [Bacteroidales bacterium]
MEKSDIFQSFYDALIKAAANIDNNYYHVKLAYFNQTMYRENIYCAELYHQLRKILGDDYPYLLKGNVDKASHPDIVERCLEFEPEFLIHKPGIFDPESSISIVFVCSILSAFRYHENLTEKFIKSACSVNVDGGYHKAIILIYGDDSPTLDKGIFDTYKNYCRGLYDKVLLLYHNKIGEKPELIKIN